MQPPVITPPSARTVVTPAPPSQRLVLRQCACGGSAGVDDDCADCRQKRLSGKSSDVVQAKLLLSQPGDPYEQEADRVADQVMRSSAPTDVQAGTVDDERLQSKPLDLGITPLATRPLVGRGVDAPARATGGGRAIQRDVGPVENAGIFRVHRGVHMGVE